MLSHTAAKISYTFVGSVHAAFELVPSKIELLPSFVLQTQIVTVKVAQLLRKRVVY